MISKSNQDQPKVVRKSPIFILALAFLVISLACSSTVPFSTSKAPLGLIVYVGNDGNIYTIDPAEKQPKAITQDANLNPAAGQAGQIYRYPTWAPDGKHLAFVRLSSGGSGPEASLFSAMLEGKKPVNNFTSQKFFPFYLSWSPNSQIIAFLGNDVSGGLDQYLVAPSGGKSKLIKNGEPYYWTGPLTTKRSLSI